MISEEAFSSLVLQIIDARKAMNEASMAFSEILEGAGNMVAVGSWEAQSPTRSLIVQHRHSFVDVEFREVELRPVTKPVALTLDQVADALKHDPKATLRQIKHAHDTDVQIGRVDV